MKHFDLPLDELRAYRPAIAVPDDFDAFWEKTLAATREHDPAVSFEPYETPLTGIRTWDVTFAGYDGHPVKGWFTAPAAATGPLPLVVQYHGYGGGRGLPHSWGLWPLAGYAHFVMDVRGQGSGGELGHTPDPVGSGPSSPGFMTRGIEDPATYFYRRVHADAVRGLEAARTHELADASRTVVVGGSQGGGISLAVGALVPDLAATCVDVPFLCHFERAMSLAHTGPYPELVAYLRMHRGAEENVLRTLSHFDGATFAARATAPALFSVALMDTSCPPSTVFAAYNAYAGEKRIEVFPYNGHEGGGVQHEETALRWVREVLAGPGRNA
ncbi:acetylxylan esterase [Streptomyces sp. NPDC048172]|uniref:acetylxylan esterase n=1 Tax=Streptomyces sp. NPDC048172 TaxID=3365505 RepID=UPI00371C8F03